MKSSFFIYRLKIVLSTLTILWIRFGSNSDTRNTLSQIVIQTQSVIQTDTCTGNKLCHALINSEILMANSNLGRRGSSASVSLKNGKNLFFSHIYFLNERFRELRLAWVIHLYRFEVFRKKVRGVELDRINQDFMKTN